MDGPDWDSRDHILSVEVLTFLFFHFLIPPCCCKFRVMIGPTEVETRLYASDSCWETMLACSTANSVDLATFPQHLATNMRQRQCSSELDIMMFLLGGHVEPTERFIYACDGHGIGRCGWLDSSGAAMLERRPQICSTMRRDLPQSDTPDSRRSSNLTARVVACPHVTRPGADWVRGS